MDIVLTGAVDVPIYSTLSAKQIEFIFNDAQVPIGVVSNQSQLTKVMKIRKQLKTLRKIIMMSEKAGTPANGFVIGFSKLYDLGTKNEKRDKDYLDKCIKKISPDDRLTIIYTSETTGDPKGVMLTRGNLVSNIIASAEVIPIIQDHIVLSFLPLCHSFERMAGYYTAMACGTSIAYAESAETVRDNLLEVHPTIVTTVPRLFDRIQSRIKKQIDEGSVAKQKIVYWALNPGREYTGARKKGEINPVLKAQYALADVLVFQKLKERAGGKVRFFVSGGVRLFHGIWGVFRGGRHLYNRGIWANGDIPSSLCQ